MPIIAALLFIFNTLISLIIAVVIINAVISWLIAFDVLNVRNSTVYRIVSALDGITEPMLRPLRRIVPNLGGIDITPIPSHYFTQGLADPRERFPRSQRGRSLELIFKLDPRLEASSAHLLHLEVCEVRLQLDARFPWLVLVPRRLGARELEDLAPDDLVILTHETVAAGRAVKALGFASGEAVEKLNVGALGNIVPQLHLHVIGRRASDPAWPGPVWGLVNQPSMRP